MNLRRRPKRAAHAPVQAATAAIVIPDTVRAALTPTRLFPPPEVRAELRQFLAGLDLPTAPADATLIDVVLLAIATTDPAHPDLPAWAAYALSAGRQLHPDDHPRNRRARLAHTAVRHGILPVDDTAGTRDETDVTRAVRHCITDTTAQPIDNEDSLTDLLTAYTGLHAHGLCDDALTETTLIAQAGQPGDRLPGGLPATVIVLTALLTACARHPTARQVLDDHRHLLDPPSSLSRELFAVCALTLTDHAAGHQQVCTTQARDRQPYDRHTWSALLHGEPPDQHVSPLPAPPAPFRPSLTDLPRLIAYASSDHHRRPRQYPAMMHITGISLACDTCRLALDLGDTTVHPHTPATPASPITLDGQPAWHHPTLRPAIWRMLTDHLGHQLHAITHTSPPWAAHTTMNHIGRPARSANIDHHTYTDGWPHHPALAGYRGRTPQPSTAESDNDAYLICVDCHLTLVLGTHTIHPDNPHTTAITIADGCAADHHTATTALIRLLTDHAGHLLLTTADDYTWLGYTATRDWAYTIHADPHEPTAFGDITHAQYTAGWPYNPRLTRYRGFDPVDGLPTHPALPARATPGRPSLLGADMPALHSGASPGATR